MPIPAFLRRARHQTRRLLPLLALLLAAAPSPLPAQTTPQDALLDLSTVTQVRVVGDAARTVLTTRADAPATGRITQSRQGWIGSLRSLWSYDDCASASQTRIEDGTLTVTVATSLLASCHMVFTATLRPGTSVVIEQPAADIELTGAFDRIAVTSAAASVAFQGEARAMALTGTALNADLAYATLRGQETIALTAKFLSADVRFASVEAISYRVDADAALVNSRYPNTPGATPDIRVTAEKARVSIQ